MLMDNVTIRRSSELHSLSLSLSLSLSGQKHACSTLGLDTKGIAEVLRRRLIDYVDGDEVKNKQVRNIITVFNDESPTGNEETKGASGPANQSQSLLFPPSQGLREANVQSDGEGVSSVDSDDDNNDDNDNEDDKENDANHSMTNGSKTSTPCISASSKNKKQESLTAKVKNWIGKPGILRAKNVDVQDAIEVIDKSFNAMYLNNEKDLEEEKEIKKGEEGAKAKEDEEVIDLTSQPTWEAW